MAGSSDSGSSQERGFWHGAVRAWVREVLVNARDHAWTLQGFGMLRLKLSDPALRLHVWDSRFRVPNVSDVHDHPWSYESCVVAGVVRQYSFEHSNESARSAMPFQRVQIVCGAGACQTSQPERVWLTRTYEEWHAGRAYWERAEDVHRSFPDDGTVTIVRRIFREDTEHAHVYYQTPSWVSAEPRDATPAEVLDITQRSLELWFREGR